MTWKRINKGRVEIRFSVERAWEATLKDKKGNIERARKSFLETYGIEITL